MSLTDGYYSLSKDINKLKEGENEGTVGQLTPELELNMSDEELIKLKKQWMKSWEDFNVKVSDKQTKNEEYWLGKQFNSDKGAVDNLIFESLETFLPIATRPKAEPVVDADNSEAGNALANNVRRMIAKKADDLSFNIKLKQVVRYWGLYFLGAMKFGWSVSENDITCQALRPQKLILDPESTIEEGEYQGEYIGEYRKDTASNLIKRFPEKKDVIIEKVKGKMGTSITYVEWWSNDYLFWTLDDDILGKTKNPHWNYDMEQPMQAPVDEFGQPASDPYVEVVPGRNHFKTPKMPYVFLSIFNLGKHPIDDTNLIEQNRSLQDLINKRLTQIDNNADDANNGWVLSGDAFTKEQAKAFSNALRRGGTGWVPTGDVNKAAVRSSPTALPAFVYESLLDYRNELRNIFGTRGSTPQGTVGEKTVRGKLIVKGQDTDRIGGGVSVFLEQMADKAFNWFVQLFMVYYDEPHTAAVLGKERALEYISLQSSDFVVDLTVSVKEGSMIPTDPMSKRNEAVDLWSAGGIDPITFFDRLEFPNPRESAKQLYLWMADPIQLFPDLVKKQQQQLLAQQALQPTAGVPPAEEATAPPEVEGVNLNEVPIQ